VTHPDVALDRAMAAQSDGASPVRTRGGHLDRRSARRRPPKRLRPARPRALRRHVGLLGGLWRRFGAVRPYDAARFDFYSPKEVEKLVATAATATRRSTAAKKRDPGPRERAAA